MPILEIEEKAICFIGELELIPCHDSVSKLCNCGSSMFYSSCPSRKLRLCFVSRNNRKGKKKKEW